ncbi:hypothetical protein [Mesobacillus jeotgali]|uniref:Lipoprotein n=1 Tax=Mesobacillus jeotgali TaxID=129985 RepID=A0ABY9VLV8_9BACI|nr:hypothetical protein [Mesobacillus jeotgali]WNF24941.1 hypothetical protein RH061_10840 [Mesobacillus jeotgali]
MKRVALLVFIFIFVLTGCTITRDYYQVFKGKSDHWSAVLIQKGKVEYRDHDKFENHYEMKYERNHTLKLQYIGNELDLGRTVEYSYDYGSSVREVLEGEPIAVDEVFTSSSSSEGTSHIPKDSNYKPLDNKDTIFEVIIKWNGKEEKIKLKGE